MKKRATAILALSCLAAIGITHTYTMAYDSGVSKEKKKICCKVGSRYKITTPEACRNAKGSQVSLSKCK